MLIAQILVCSVFAILVAGAVAEFWTHRTGQVHDVTPPSHATSTITSIRPVPTSTTSPSLLLNSTMAQLLGRRLGVVEVAVQDVTSGRIWTFGPETPQDEASVMKVNILVALLANAEHSNASLSASQSQLAEEMIEQSDNNAATDLWNAVGASNGIAVFDRSIGLRNTIPSTCIVCAGFPWPGWGLSTTTPLDQLTLLRDVLVNAIVLTPSDRAFALKLMDDVIPSERWGVTGGVPDNASVALKNGWLPLNASDSDWQINSIGWVQGEGRNYIVALLSTGNPSENYGIQTLNEVSALLWRYVTS